MLDEFLAKLLVRRYTSAATGRRIVPVRCEKCGTKFQYELLRDASGEESAVFFVGIGRAKQRASDLASKKLRAKLEREADPVPCPKCHWINAELIAGYRRTLYQGVPKIGYVLALLVWIVILGEVVPGLDPNNYVLNDTLALIGTAAAIGIGFLLQWFMRRRFDPNRDFPQPPTVPSGTPRGIPITAPATRPSSQWPAPPNA